MNKQLKQFWQDFCQRHNLEYDTPVEVWACNAAAGRRIGSISKSGHKNGYYFCLRTL